MNVGDLVKRKLPPDLAGRFGIVVWIDDCSEHVKCSSRSAIQVLNRGRVYSYWAGDWEVFVEIR